MPLEVRETSFVRHGWLADRYGFLDLAVVSDEVHLWEVHAGEQLAKIPRASLDLEARLEDWLAADISILDPSLLVIGRQIETEKRWEAACRPNGRRIAAANRMRTMMNGSAGTSRRANLAAARRETTAKRRCSLG